MNESETRRMAMLKDAGEDKDAELIRVYETQVNLETSVADLKRERDELRGELDRVGAERDRLRAELEGLGGGQQ